MNSSSYDESENIDGKFEENKEVLKEDLEQFDFSADQIVKISTILKSNLCNITVGVANLHCQQKNRVPTEKWYPWGAEFYNSLKKSQDYMTEVFKTKNHKELREICILHNSSFWTDPTIFKPEGTYVQKLLELTGNLFNKYNNGGFITQWGNIKPKSVFRVVSEKILEEKNVDFFNYVEIKEKLWNDREKYYNTKKNNLMSLMNNLFHK